MRTRPVTTKPTPLSCGDLFSFLVGWPYSLRSVVVGRHLIWTLEKTPATLRVIRRLFCAWQEKNRCMAHCPYWLHEGTPKDWEEISIESRRRYVGKGRLAAISSFDPQVLCVRYPLLPVTWDWHIEKHLKIKVRVHLRSVIPTRLKDGDRVKITYGPFEGFEGTIGDVMCGARPSGERR